MNCVMTAQASVQAYVQAPPQNIKTSRRATEQLRTQGEATTVTATGTQMLRIGVNIWLGSC